MEQQTPLAEMSRSIELDHIESGVRAYRNMLQTVERSRLAPEQHTLAYYIACLETRVISVQAQLLRGDVIKGCRKWGPFFLAVSPDCLAAITVSTVFNACACGDGGPADRLERQTHSVSSSIARGVKAQLELDKFRRDHPALFHKWRTEASEWTPKTHLRFKRKDQLDQLEWDAATRMHVGQRLLWDMLQACPDMIRLQRRWRNRGGRWTRAIHVQLDEDVMNRIADSHESREILFTPKPWMLVPPIPWDHISPDEPGCGGYLIIKSDFIRQRGPCPPELKYHDLKQTFDAVNYIQSVPYRINPDTYSVVKEFADAGVAAAGLAQAEPHRPDPKPDYSQLSEGQIKLAKQNYRQWLSMENERIGRRVANLHTLSAARRYERYDSIWTPWNCDFRGRVYPDVSSISPQGSDLNAGLLTFAKSVPQTEEGRYWLAVHLANCAGADKVPFDERVRWVRENERNIALSAEDPHRHRWWQEQDDKPVKLLAACREWIRKDGLTSLPVAQDGSCSGIQHIGALMRDPLAAAAVNLTPGSKPEDIYARVAEKVMEILSRDVKDGRIWFDGDAERAEYRKTVARYWYDMGVTRSTVKRATMTIPYGLTDEGMARQFVADRWCTYLNQAHYLTDRVNEALDETLGKARAFMSWIQECGAIMAKANVPCRWMSPNNFLAIQEYAKTKTRTIFTALQKLSYPVPDRDAGLDVDQMKRGIAPNYIHSFDASHVTMVANVLREQGVPAFLPVHDSFAVHSPYVPLMRQTLREQFVKMYKQRDWISHQHRVWQIELGDGLPEPPDRGDFDIDNVLQSPYLFS